MRPEPAPLTERALVAAGWVILVFMAWFRLSQLDLMLFDFDEGIASIYAFQLLGKGIVPIVGVKTSLGFYNPPLFIYVISLPYLFSPSPVVATAFLQILLVVAVWWLWKILRRFPNGALPALVVIALVAFAPGPLLLGRRLWGHSLIPTFSVLAFCLVLRLGGKPRDAIASVLLPIVVSAAQQVHFSGALLLFDAVLAALVLQARPSWKWVAAGCGLAGLTYIPYVVHQFQNGFADMRIVVRLIFGGAEVGAVRQPLYVAVLHSLSDFGSCTAFQHNYVEYLRGLPSFRAWRWIAATWFVLACLATFVRLGGLRVIRSRPSPGAGFELDLVALIWILVPLAIFSVLKIETVPAYWLVALPGPWVIAARIFLPCRASGGVLRRASLWAGLALVCAGSGAGAFYLLRYHAAMSRPDPKLVVYPSYRDQYDAMRFVCAHSEGQRVLMTQEARSLEAGLDYQVNYLLAMIEGNTTRFSPDGSGAPTRRYLLHNRAKELPPELHRQLTNWRERTFGLMRVYWKPAARER